MTLATRCSACGTSFRVVQDQLKVSGGWVRCGRCNEVFNALESLYEIESQATATVSTPPVSPSPSSTSPPPPAAAPSATPPSPVQPAVEMPRPAPAAPAASLWGRRRTEISMQGAVEPDLQTPPSDPAAFSAPQEAGGSSLPLGPVAGLDQATDPRPEAAPAPESAWVPFGGVWPPSAEDSRAAAPTPSPSSASNWSVPGAGVGHGPSAAPTWSSPAAAPSEPAEWDDRPVHGFEDVETRLEPRAGEDIDIGPTPSFLRPSQQLGPPERPGQRRAWTAATVGLGLLVALQLMLAWRDSLAARVPALEPLLSVACAPFGCTVNAPRNLAAMALEGSNLRQRGGVGTGYDFIVSLRNRSNLPVMWPAFELTLTDSQGQPLMRRVLSVQDFGVRDSRLGPAAEINLMTQLDVADRRIAGYTVEIFYP